MYKFARFFTVRMSPEAGYALATFLSYVKYYISPRDRNAVIENLKRILPAQDQKKVRRYAKEVFVNFGKYLIEFFRFSLLTKDDLGKFLKIQGIEHIDHALKDGKGVIVLSAHMGNWELGGVFMALLGYPMVAVALPHRHHKVNALFNQQREKMGVAVIPSLGMALRRVFAALRANNMVALVGDRDFTTTGLKMDFLGAQKIIPRGPAFLALRTQAPIIPAFVIRQKDDTHILEFLKPLEASDTEEQLMDQYAKIMEMKIRQYPDQWLLFREFWRE
ncbi:MAG: lysophospholipid acyltransferase family protein [Candidatus Omnitrophota bacterium]